jgi:hypothetical protein
MTPQELMKICNEKLKFADNIYGNLSLIKNKIWTYLKGDKSPGYIYLKLDQEGNVYSPSGKEPLFNLSSADPQRIQKYGNHAYAYHHIKK